MTYPLLFSPAKINQLTLKNRLVMTPMGCGLANADGTITDEFIAYYEERAKGGAALLYTEVSCVNEVHGRRALRQICVTDDCQISMLKKLTDTMHSYQCAIFTQLLHPGVMSSNAANGGRALVGPSGIASQMIRQEVREITLQEIRQLPVDFANGANRAKRAGFDGVEVHAAHHYLLHEFLSPHFNKRTDQYGGSFENRSRLLLEILDAIREKVGADYPISVRVSAEDYMGSESCHLDEILQLCQKLEQHGADVISVSAGGTENGRSHSIEPIPYAQGWRRHFAKAIRKMVSIPVITTAVIRDPDYAEQLLMKGYTDFIGMGRSFLADPMWPKKAAEGREADIRKCISCLRCIDSIKAEQPICCSINPKCGKEMEDNTLTQDGDGRLCVVVGGGVAGMECARILSLRGFRVCLYEKNKHLGGQVWLAGQAPNQGKMLWIVEYLAGQLKKQSVDICLEYDISPEEILRTQPYLVVDATGASPYFPDTIEGIHSSLVTTPVEVLSGTCKLENRSVVMLGTGLTALETAEYLMERGNLLTIIGQSDQIAPGGGSRVVVGEILRRLQMQNAVVLTGRKTTKIGEDRIWYENVHTGEQYTLPCDKVVLCKGVRPNGGLGEALAGKHPNVKVIGDASKCSRILEAVRAGYLVGKEA